MVRLLDHKARVDPAPQVGQVQGINIPALNVESGRVDNLTLTTGVNISELESKAQRLPAQSVLTAAPKPKKTR